MDDHRKKPCPQCKKQGLYLDPSTGQLRCRYCKASGIALPPKKVAATATKQITKPSKKNVPKQGNIPPLPQGTPITQIVDEYWVDEEGKRHQIARIHCPHNPQGLGDDTFDPQSFWARVAFQRFSKEFAKRRRYNRDLIRRARAQNRPLRVWDEAWYTREGQLTLEVADDILKKVRLSLKRQKKDKAKESDTKHE